MRVVLRITVRHARNWRLYNASLLSDGLCIANDKDNKRCYMLVHQINRLSSPSTLIVNHDAATFPEVHVKDVSELTDCESNLDEN